MILNLILLTQIISKVLYVNQVIRYGARYPSENTDYKNKLLADEHLLGQMLPSGLRQMWSLGNQLKQVYIGKDEDGEHILEPFFDQNTMEIISTRDPRNIQSAQALLSGMFPDPVSLPENLELKYKNPPYNYTYPAPDWDAEGTQVSNPSINRYQPFPIITNGAYDNGNALNPLNVCPGKEMELIKENKKDNSEKLDEMFKFYDETAKILLKVSNQEGKEINQEIINATYDQVDSYLHQAKNFPLGIDEDSWEKIQEMESVSSASYYGNKKLTTLSNINIFNQFILSFDCAIYYASDKKDNTEFAQKCKDNDRERKKWSLYSGKEDTILHILQGLGMTSFDCQFKLAQGKPIPTNQNCFLRPKFGANLLIELNQSSEGVYYITVQYDDQFANLCGNGIIRCGWEKFRQQLLDLNKEGDFKEDCGEVLLSVNQEVEGLELMYQYALIIFAVFAIFFILLLLICLCITCAMYRSAKTEQKYVDSVMSSEAARQENQNRDDIVSTQKTPMNGLSGQKSQLQHSQFVPQQSFVPSQSKVPVDKQPFYNSSTHHLQSGVYTTSQIKSNVKING